MEPIYTYRDYRQFLKDKYLELKKDNKAFSYRYFAKKAGYASPNFLKLVMEGKRNLSSESVHRFAKALKLSNKEQRFFELLVHYDQAGEPHLKENYYRQLLEFPEHQKVRHLEKEQYEFLSKWQHPAILELTSLPDFIEDPHWIAKKLAGRITPKEASQSIELLLNLKLLSRNQAGKLEASPLPLTTGDEAIALAAHRFHEQILEIARKAIGKQGPEQREFAAMTMAISQEQLKDLKVMIRDFRKQVLNYLGGQKGRVHGVFELSLQLFELTEKT